MNEMFAEDGLARSQLVALKSKKTNRKGRAAARSYDDELECSVEQQEQLCVG